jgi:linoleoyl-CoA desaturase
MQSIKFKSKSNETLFFDELKREINIYFLKNKLSSTANFEMVFKVVFWLVSWAVTWAAIIVFKDDFWLAFSIGTLHMFTHLMIAFNITHDANHSAISNNKTVNHVLGYLIEILGCNKKLWILGHNQDHHSFINIHEHDNNIDGYKLLRLCPQEKLLKHHKFQWLYAPFIYGLATLNYATFRDIKMMFRYVSKSKFKISASFLLEFFVFKVLYYSYIFLIPIFVFGVGFKVIISFFLLGHFINGMFLALVFLIPHLTENTSYPLPENGVVNKNWAVHVINTTGDFATQSKFMEWFVGGINLHVAHHLFPKICHVHYKNISPIIKKVSNKHGFVYREKPTFLAGLKSHFALLKHLGSAA